VRGRGESLEAFCHPKKKCPDAYLGGATEGIDIEVENPSTGEIAFVQIKSSATQSILNDYLSKFNERKSRYDRMIFAVHPREGSLSPPQDKRVQVWGCDRIAELIVRLGLGDWITKRL